jgi:preprotein translocase subunit SecF
MKKLLIVLAISVSVIACKEQSATTEKQPIGFDMAGGTERTTLYGGDTTHVTLFENWIQALNDRDTAKLRSLEATDSLKIYAPNGDLLTAGQDYKNYMAKYFTNMNPKWKLNFAIANKSTDKNGKVSEWVTSSGTVTHTVDGKESKVNRYFDANIVNGKIQKMYIADRTLPQGE